MCKINRWCFIKISIQKKKKRVSFKYRTEINFYTYSWSCGTLIYYCNKLIHDCPFFLLTPFSLGLGCSGAGPTLFFRHLMPITEFNAPVPSSGFAAFPSFFSLYFRSAQNLRSFVSWKSRTSWAWFNSLGHLVEALFCGLPFSSTCFGPFLGPLLLFSWASWWGLFSPPFLNCRWPNLCLPHPKVLCRETSFLVTLVKLAKI